MTFFSIDAEKRRLKLTSFFRELNTYNFYLEGRKRRIDFFRALYDEIKVNHSITQKLLKIERDISISVPELPTFYTQSYQNIRTTGELFILPEELRRELGEVFELIHVHTLYGSAACDPGVRKNISFYERLENISKKLEHLKNELPKILKFLNQRPITIWNDR